MPRLLLALFLTLTAWSGENMIGRQSQNEGILVLPAPGPVTVDGKLDDWDLSGRIWVFADKSVRDQYSVKVSAMWTAESLYLALQWRDPTPMFSDINPAYNPSEGWKSDALQLRVASGEYVQWLTLWHYAAQRQPVLHQSVWKDPRSSRAGQVTTLHPAEPGGTRMDNGAQMAYLADADGAGYVQEILLPWSLVHGEAREMAAGMAVRIGMEFLWGDVTGKTWPEHRYADNMQPGVTSREFYWEARHAWGDARLVATGDVEPRRYVSDEAVLEGDLPIEFTVPKDTKAVSLVIADAAGQVQRNLGGLDPQDYLVEESADGLKLRILWDGQTDALWQRADNRSPWVALPSLVQPGTYSVRGVYHTGITARFDMCFYNPGDPAWYTADGSGTWGADHTNPHQLARAGDWMIVAWPFAEGGSGMIGIDPAGHKRWGDKRGADLIAATAQYLYAVNGANHDKTTLKLLRIVATSGAYAPFQLNGVARDFELPATVIVGEANHITAIAADATRLVLGSSDGRLLHLHPESAEVVHANAVGAISALAFAADGTLYGIVDGALQRLDPATGAATAIATPGLAQAGAISVDADGHIVIVDRGPDSQVKAYSPAGALVYRIGDPGGRPIRGAWQPSGLRPPSAVAVDARDRVWTVEDYAYPRRVTVWNRDGSIFRDYVGGTGYAGTGCYLHDQDPGLAYYGTVEMKIDHATHTWEVTRILWVPDRAKGETFTIDPSHSLPQRFSATVNGQAHEYLFTIPYRNSQGYVLYMQRPDGWRPTNAVTTVGEICNIMDGRGQPTGEPSGEWAGHHPFDAVIWNDRDDDGIVQKAECEIVPAVTEDARGNKLRRIDIPLPMGNGWSCPMAQDLSFYANGLYHYVPTGYSDTGAPIYAQSGIRPLETKVGGAFGLAARENTLMVQSGSSSPDWLYGLDATTGALKWKYANPYPNVHGSHRATMPAPGLLIGPLKILGTMDLGEFGSVFAMRGNLGQDFYMTADGIYIDSMFVDCRLPNRALPASTAALQDQPMNGYSNGGEPFNGWIGRQADGTVRMLNGMSRQAGMIHRIDGLDSLTRFTLAPITLDAPTLAKLDDQNKARAAARVVDKPRTYTISRLAAAPTVDGDGKDWPSKEPMLIKRSGATESAEAQLSYDDQYLYAHVLVTDASPWKNAGKDFARLFKTGDSVDIQLSPGGNKGREPVAGDLRVVISQVGGQPVAVLMRPVDADAPKTLARTYVSPVQPRAFDRVQILEDARIAVKKTGAGYSVEAAIPLAAIGLTPESGKLLRGDVGFTSSDVDGAINVARTYWANPNTNLVNDEPAESWLYPAEYGTFSID